MLILSLEEARAGMTLAAPVYHPEQPEQQLLRHGYVLEDAVLRRLHEMQIGCIYVNCPGFEELDRHLEVQLSPARRMLYQQIKQAITASQKKTRPAVSYSGYYSATRDMIVTLMAQGQHPIYLDQMSRLGSAEVEHATAVAHLALLLGIKLEMYLIEQRARLPASHAKQVVNLGVAGMMHDMGKVQLPPHLHQYNGVHAPERPSDREEWESHVQLGYDLIQGGVEPSAAAAVLHHHQHFDGSGFPSLASRGDEAPREQRIHIFARILQAADLYDRLSAPRDSTRRRSNLEVLHLMHTGYAGRIDPVILDMLATIAPPFVPGSTIGLSDGTRAVIMDVNPREPYTPRVKRMAGDGSIEPDVVQIGKASGLFIETIGDLRVQPMLDEIATPQAA